MSNPLSRRQFAALAMATAAASTLPAVAQAPAAPPSGPFKLPALPYAPEALEPHIDALTMTTHHTKHHQAYVNGLNTALASHEKLQAKTLEELIGGISFLPQDIQKPVQNHGGGHWNHSFFWSIMGPGGTGAPDAGLEIAAAIEKTFKSFDAFKAKFAEAGVKRFGSGWAWLIVRPDGSLSVVSTPNQDNPLMQGITPNSDLGKPVLAIDVWEHAYYLKYQSKRADYITAWWNVVNWTKVNEIYKAALPPAKGK